MEMPCHDVEIESIFFSKDPSGIVNDASSGSGPSSLKKIQFVGILNDIVIHHKQFCEGRSSSLRPSATSGSSGPWRITIERESRERVSERERIPHSLIMEVAQDISSFFLNEMLADVAFLDHRGQMIAVGHRVILRGHS